MGRCARHFFKRPEKVIRAQACHQGKAIQILRSIFLVLDHPDDARDASPGAWLTAGSGKLNTLCNLDRSCCNPHAQLLTNTRIVPGENRRNFRNQWSQRADRWQARHLETNALSPNVIGEMLEEIRHIRKGDTAISDAVIMPTGKGFTGVAKKPRSRSHQAAACRRTILKSASDNDGDRGLRMPFLEGTVPGARGTNNVRYGPPVSGGDEA